MQSEKSHTSPSIVQLSPRGQLTLPREIRKLAGIHGGDPMIVSIERGCIVLTPAVITPIERYTDEHEQEFKEAAQMSEEEMKEARKKQDI